MDILMKHFFLLFQAALTSPGDFVNVDWSGLVSGGDLEMAVQYEQAPKYSAAIMLQAVREIYMVSNSKRNLYCLLDG